MLLLALLIGPPGFGDALRVRQANHHKRASSLAPGSTARSKGADRRRNFGSGSGKGEGEGEGEGVFASLASVEGVSELAELGGSVSAESGRWQGNGKEADKPGQVGTGGIRDHGEERVPPGVHCRSQPFCFPVRDGPALSAGSWESRKQLIVQDWPPIPKPFLPRKSKDATSRFEDGPRPGRGRG